MDQTSRAPCDTPAPDTHVSEVCNDLVIAQLSLAEAKGEKQNLVFEMNKLRKSQRTIQDLLAPDTSRMEVQLAQENQKIDRM